MTGQRRTRVIRGDVSSADALKTVQAMSDNMVCNIDCEVLYPYYWFDADCTVPVLFGRKVSSVHVLVDAVNGLGATSDSFDLDELAICSNDLLPAACSVEQAGCIARRSLTHSLGRRLRVIASFDVALHLRGIVFKRFWIVNGGQTRTMIDSTTGRIHPLGSRAA